MQIRSSSKHTKVSDANDERVILKELTEMSSVFDYMYVPGRVHVWHTRSNFLAKEERLVEPHWPSLYTVKSLRRVFC